MLISVTGNVKFVPVSLFASVSLSLVLEDSPVETIVMNRELTSLYFMQKDIHATPNNYSYDKLHYRTKGFMHMVLYLLVQEWAPLCNRATTSECPSFFATSSAVIKFYKVE